MLYLVLVVGNDCSQVFHGRWSRKKKVLQVEFERIEALLEFRYRLLNCTKWINASLCSHKVTSAWSKWSFAMMDGSGTMVAQCSLKRAKNNGGCFTHADWMWNQRILAILNRKIGLITANAYISTLGGGHYLCFQIGAAEEMARRQYRIALRLGDPVLASQCRIHYVYSQIQRGRLRYARRLLRQEWILQGRHPLIKGMVQAAWHYVKKLKQVAHHLQKPAVDPTDTFYRQRFVETSMR